MINEENLKVVKLQNKIKMLGLRLIWINNLNIFKLIDLKKNVIKIEWTR